MKPQVKVLIKQKIKAIATTEVKKRAQALWIKMIVKILKKFPREDDL